MKTFESFLDMFKKDNKINQSIINTINEYGFEITFNNNLTVFDKISNSIEFTPKIRTNVNFENGYPNKGYTIELRFFDMIGILNNKSLEKFVFDYLKTHSLINSKLYIWDYEKEDNYYQIVINEKLADLIKKNINKVEEEYYKNQEIKKFKI